jgi:alanyl-tRNA synthetase
MTSAQIRQSYLDFFQEKGHTIVPSSSLLPESPGLLFTNAGMNQFVPIFLNETPCPYSPPRAADTQKCIRAGGKHNDLEDVGLDTYHHTLFEMLGNWSFGDYFKKEAITWAWELVVDRWKFPPQRLYATVYSPDKSKGDPADFDQEAYDIWAALFTKAGLDPKVHIVNGNKKDNFWMMGETGPCGPCSEIHVDLTPEARTLELEKRGATLVNSSDARCMEIWNLVFIQFNANADGTFRPLPAKHVDTGMGFERVCSILQCTKNFTDFTGTISNYETDVFSPIFRELEKISEKKYTSTLPKQGVIGLTDQERQDVAFRVIADHIRTLSLSVADGILPGNNGRNYVLRRILRRAILWSRALGLHEPFFYKLVPTVVDQLSPIFPELKKNQPTIEKVLKAEEESFNRTLDNGIALFNEFLSKQGAARSIPGDIAFKLYDTYGFPLDMTELMARERGLSVDTSGFEKLMQEQKERSQAAQKKEIIDVADTDDSIPAVEFVGYDATEALVQMATYKIEFGKTDDDTVKARLYFSPTPFYAEMGGQVGDTGWLEFGNHRVEILDTKKAGRGVAHLTEDIALLDELALPAKAVLNLERRALIEAHHSATHLLHWALREVLGTTVGQKGSYVGPDRLRFDFSHLEAMKPDELQKVEAMVNEKVAANMPVKWQERPYAEVKGDSSIIQFFGDKYGETVRVVDIGGFSKELCAGTHVKQTGKIGVFRIVSEGAIAAGVRRIEALCGPAINSHLETVFAKQNEEANALAAKSGTQLNLAGLSNDPAESWAAYQANESQISNLKSQSAEADKAAAKAKGAELAKRAAVLVGELTTKAVALKDVPVIIADLGDADPALLPLLAGEFKKSFHGVVVVGGRHEGKAVLGAFVVGTAAGKANAGAIIKEIAPLVGGKGGGKPDLAQGGGTNPAALESALEAAKAFLSR